MGLLSLLGARRSFTMCGTAEYMAPEVVRGTGYGFSADWRDTPCTMGGSDSLSSLRLIKHCHPSSSA